MNNLDFIYKRHSVRKFLDKKVPLEDIKKIVKTATYAPSGKNLQNWHFVVINNQNKIDDMAKIVEKKNEELATYVQDEDKANSFRKYVKYHTVFRNAPTVILLYAGSYPITGLEFLQAKEGSEDEVNSFLETSPRIQNIGAAMENLLLSAAAMGYGGCWMTGPNYACKELEEYIGFVKDGYSLVSMTPLGIPLESEQKSPSRKPLEEVMTIIE